MTKPNSPDEHLAVFPVDSGMGCASLAILTEYGVETGKPFTLHVGRVENLNALLEYLVPDADDAHRIETQNKMVESGAKVVLATTAGDLLRACTHELNGCPHRHALLDGLWHLGLLAWNDLPERFQSNYAAKELRERKDAGASVH